MSISRGPNNTQLAKLYTVTLSLQDHTHEVLHFMMIMSLGTGEINFGLSFTQIHQRYNGSGMVGLPHPNTIEPPKIFYVGAAEYSTSNSQVTSQKSKRHWPQQQQQ